MLAIDVKSLNNSDPAEAQISVTAPGGSPGIESVKVTGITGAVLDQETPPNCPAHFVFFLRAVPFAALPFYVDATECQIGVDQGQTNKTKTSGGPYLGELINMVHCNPQGQNQNNPTCTALQNEITKQRNVILAQCGDAAQLKGQRDAAWAASTILAATGAIFFTLSFMAPWPFNLVLWIIAAAFAVAAIITGIVGAIAQANLDQLLGKMSQERADLAKIIPHLNDVCCPEFVGVPRDVPLCP